MFCRNCGTDIADSKFCHNCGYKNDITVQKSVPIDEDNTALCVDETQNANDETTESISPDVNVTVEISAESELPEEEPKKRTALKKITKIIFNYSFLTSMVGAVLFLGIVTVGLIGWGDVYLFGGYDYVKVLSIISMCLMLLGAAGMITFLVTNLIIKTKPLFNKKSSLVLTCILLLVSIGLSVWGFVDASINSYDYNYSGGSSGGSSYNDYYSSGISKNIGLSLKVDSIKTSGSYTYVYCSVKNVSSNYGVATKYRYVKVKAVFKNYSGSIVDTDWTYAVDSTWIEPGETKTFYYMVKNTNVKTATLSFID